MSANPHIMKRKMFRLRIWQRSDKKCFYCKRDLVFSGIKKANKMTVEHLVPRSEGGKTNLTNCVAACLECNDKRANKKIKDFVDPPKPIIKIEICECASPMIRRQHKKYFCVGCKKDYYLKD